MIWQMCRNHMSFVMISGFWKFRIDFGLNASADFPQSDIVPLQIVRKRIKKLWRFSWWSFLQTNTLCNSILCKSVDYGSIQIGWSNELTTKRPKLAVLKQSIMMGKWWESKVLLSKSYWRIFLRAHGNIKIWCAFCNPMIISLHIAFV